MKKGDEHAVRTHSGTDIEIILSFVCHFSGVLNLFSHKSHKHTQSHIKQFIPICLQFL